MRLLRELDDEISAQRLVDALSDQGIESELKPHERGYRVWVLDEEHMRRANELVAGWLDGDRRSSFEQSSTRGMRERELRTRIEERQKRHVELLAQKLQAVARPRPTPLTWGLILLSVAVAVLTSLGEERAMVATLTIVDPREPISVLFFSAFGLTVPWLQLPLDQPWRLVTPVFVHFGWAHIIFNLLVLRDLGRVIEGIHGARYFAVFVLLCAAVSNIAQFEISQHAQFAGMSGVVYGLLALVWIRGKLDPWIGYGLSASTRQFMLIWLVLGFVGNFGIANWCHLFGLLFGMAWAFLSHRLAAARAG